MYFNLRSSFYHIMLHNEEVWSNTIYSSSEASGVNHIIHRSRMLRWIMICFQRGRSPSWKHAVTLHFNELCNYISYHLPSRNGSRTIHWKYHCRCAACWRVTTPTTALFMWRPRDTISAQTMVRPQSGVWGGVRVGYVPKTVKIISFSNTTKNSK